ncbi:MAG: GAF domain-containing protein [Phycisphaerales bacterium]
MARVMVRRVRRRPVADGTPADVGRDGPFDGAVSESDLRRAEAACATDPIHLLPQIQPHGWLLAVDVVGVVVAVSANVPALLTCTLEELLGAQRPAAVPGNVFELAERHARRAGDGGESARVVVGERLLVATARGGNPGIAIIELVLGDDDIAARNSNWAGERAGERPGEPAAMDQTEDEGRATDAFQTERTSSGVNRDGTSGLKEAGSSWLLHRAQAYRANPYFDSLVNELADDVRGLLGSERALVYRFHGDQSGEVVGASSVDALPTYLGLRFPAGDIPAQARRLYDLVPDRQIVDGAAEPVDVIVHAGRDAPLDLSYCRLRGVPLVHRQYMANMGIRAGLSIAIRVRGRLWGLLTCHHRMAVEVPRERVSAAVLLVGLVAERLRELDPESGVAARRAVGPRLQRVSDLLDTHSDPVEVAISGAAGLRHLVDASGLIVRVGDRILTEGTVPAVPACRSLLDHLCRTMPASVWWTDEPLDEWSGTMGGGDQVSGVAAARLLPALSDIVVWLRPESIQTLDWAGDTRSRSVRISAASAVLQPRVSFRRWQETVAGRSTPWRPWEIEIIGQLQSLLVLAIGRIAHSPAEVTVARTPILAPRALASELTARRRAIIGLLTDVLEDPGSARASLELVKPLVDQFRRVAGVASEEAGLVRTMRGLEAVVARSIAAGSVEDARALGTREATRSAVDDFRSELDRAFTDATNATVAADSSPR